MSRGRICFHSRLARLNEACRHSKVCQTRTRWRLTQLPAQRSLLPEVDVDMRESPGCSSVLNLLILVWSNVQGFVAPADPCKSLLFRRHGCVLHRRLKSHGCVRGCFSTGLSETFIIVRPVPSQQNKKAREQHQVGTELFVCTFSAPPSQILKHNQITPQPFLRFDWYYMTHCTSE
jgi:hypothetical protein